MLKKELGFEDFHFEIYRFTVFFLDDKVFLICCECHLLFCILLGRDLHLGYGDVARHLLDIIEYHNIRGILDRARNLRVVTVRRPQTHNRQFDLFDLQRDQIDSRPDFVFVLVDYFVLSVTSDNGGVGNPGYL